MKKKSSGSGSRRHSQLRNKAWRTRTHGTRKQVGQKFLIRQTSMQGAKAHLPMITGHVRGHLDVSQPSRVVRLALIKVNTAQLVPRETHPVDIERRAQYFVDAYKRGLTIPPILVHRLPDGTFEIIDGHARVEAYRRLGITQIPAIENSVLESLGKGAKAVGKAITSGAKFAERAGRYGYRTGMKLGKATEEVLEQTGRLSRAYRGEISEREKLAHEERLAEIRARREPIVKREVVREAYVTGPFGGTSSPLLSQPMLQEVRQARWRVHRTRKPKVPVRYRLRKAKEAVKELPQKAKKGFRTMKEYVTSATPELYRTRRKREE